MRRRPRAPEQPLFSTSLIGWSVLQGAVLVAGVFIISYRRGMPDTEVRALAFFSLIMTIVGLIFVNRSFCAVFNDGAQPPQSVVHLGSRGRRGDVEFDVALATYQGSVPVRTPSLG